MHDAMNHSQRCEVRRTPKPTMRVLAIDTTPDGVLSKAVAFGEYPKFLISVAE
jgi:hypothetical protein